MFHIPKTEANGGDVETGSSGRVCLSDWSANGCNSTLPQRVYDSRLGGKDWVRDVFI